MNMKHNMNINCDLQIMEIKKREDERKMKAKTQRISMFTGGSGAKWSLSIFEGRVCIMLYRLSETVNSHAISQSYFIMQHHKRGRSPSCSPSYDSRRMHHYLS